MNRFFRWFGLPGRLVLTLLMSAFACVMAVLFPSLPRLLAAIAMLMSSLGDIVLMDYKPITHSLHLSGFITGSLVFVAAHLMYIAAFGTRIYLAGYSYLNPGIAAAFVCYVLLVTAAIVLVLLRNTEVNSMLWLSMIYLFVITANCATVFSYAYSAHGAALLSAVGVLLFLASDYFIVLERACGIRSRVLRELIWWLYPIGQILLLLGV